MQGRNIVISKGCQVNRFGLTIERMTTHGRLSFLTIASEMLDLPEPELPATPMMLKSAHGGE